MFKLDPTTLSDARIQLHWASQILAATANALMEIQPDDSQSNLAWDETNRAMVGREGASIEFPTFQLISPAGDLYPLLGKTLDDGMRWLGGHVEAQLVLRDYEMPSHRVATGSPFDPKLEELGELADWFTFGQEAMDDFDNCRIWPHHFDLGWMLEIDGPEKSIGGGMSPGDHSFNQPYFYINPYGIDRPAELPELGSGASWADDWFGAILTADKIVAAENPQAVAKSYFDDIVSMMKGWF
jgi:hypothetical protein